MSRTLVSAVVFGGALLCGSLSSQAAPERPVDATGAAASAAEAPADGGAELPAPTWFELTAVGPGFVLLLPSGWERVDGSTWLAPDGLKLMAGWTPGTEGGSADIAASMKQHLESVGAQAELVIEAVTDEAGELLAHDLVGSSTDAEGRLEWQWTRLVRRDAEAVVLVSARGAFDDVERIAAARRRVRPTLSSLLNARASEDADGSFHAASASDRITLGPPGIWLMLQQMWANPKVKADARLSVGFVDGASDAAAVARALLDAASGDAQPEVEVDGVLDEDAGSRELIYRIVGDGDRDGDGGPLARLSYRERVRWFRHALAPAASGTWILRAAADLEVTHPEDFLENVDDALEPVFGGWAVTPIPPER